MKLARTTITIFTLTLLTLVAQADSRPRVPGSSETKFIFKNESVLQIILNPDTGQDEISFINEDGDRKWIQTKLNIKGLTKSTVTPGIATGESRWPTGRSFFNAQTSFPSQAIPMVVNDKLVVFDEDGGRTLIPPPYAKEVAMKKIWQHKVQVIDGVAYNILLSSDPTTDVANRVMVCKLPALDGSLEWAEQSIVFPLSLNGEERSLKKNFKIVKEGGIFAFVDEHGTPYASSYVDPSASGFAERNFHYFKEEGGFQQLRMSFADYEHGPEEQVTTPEMKTALTLLESPQWQETSQSIPIYSYLAGTRETISTNEKRQVLERFVTDWMGSKAFEGSAQAFLPKSEVDVAMFYKVLRESVGDVLFKNSKNDLSLKELMAQISFQESLKPFLEGMVVGALKKVNQHPSKFEDPESFESLEKLTQIIRENLFINPEIVKILRHQITTANEPKDSYVREEYRKVQLEILTTLAVLEHDRGLAERALSKSEITQTQLTDLKKEFNEPPPLSEGAVSSDAHIIHLISMVEREKNFLSQCASEVASLAKDNSLGQK